MTTSDSELAAPAAIDPVRWPDVATVPRCSAARAAVARRIVWRALDRLPIRVATSDGRLLGRGGPLMEIRTPEAFVRRLAVGGLIGFGESYMAGEWGAPDPTAVLTVLAEHITALVPAPLQRLRRWQARRPAAERNTTTGARANIHHHYDLSNELFAAFLDPTLTYSAAVFDRLPGSWSGLAEAQRRKIDRLLDLAAVGPGTRLLEIGTGWGELAIRAAARGASVHSITLSAEQRDLASRRIKAAGQHERAVVELADYREVTGTYDAVVSVEMIEAVGAEYWPGYFRTLDRVLAPGGRVALQAITMDHDRMLTTRPTYTWIQKYIFPGGLIPSLQAIAETAAAHTRLRVTACAAYGPHYAQTLRLWRERFAERAAEVDALGFDAVFRRMWAFYLAYSQAGFASGYLDVHQIQLTRNGAA